MGVAGVVLQVALPEDIGHRCGAQGKPGMAGVRLLDGVDREGPDRVDAELIQGFAHRAQVVLRNFCDVLTDLITPARGHGIRAPRLSAAGSHEE
jgi:hypothetical protein